MSDLIAFLIIVIWPLKPLFWIPVRGLSKVFKKLDIFTYIMPLLTWLPLAYLIYQNRVFLLQFKIDLPVTLDIIGIFLLVIGALLHIWTGKLLGLRGLIGLPKIKNKLLSRGPFSVVRHPTYLAHTMIFSGVFLITGVIATGIIAFLDFAIVNIIIIPLEEKELLSRFGEDYKLYKKKVPHRFLPWKGVE